MCVPQPRSRMYQEDVHLSKVSLEEGFLIKRKNFNINILRWIHEVKNMFVYLYLYICTHIWKGKIEMEGMWEGRKEAEKQVKLKSLILPHIPYYSHINWEFIYRPYWAPDYSRLLSKCVIITILQKCDEILYSSTGVLHTRPCEENIHFLKLFLAIVWKLLLNIQLRQYFQS